MNSLFRQTKIGRQVKLTLINSYGRYEKQYDNK